MSKNIGKIIRVNSLPPKGERLTNVIYQVAVPETATYIDYAVDANGDIKTPTLDRKLLENDFGKVKTVNNQPSDENGNIALNLDYVPLSGTLPQKPLEGLIKASTNQTDIEPENKLVLAQRQDIVNSDKSLLKVIDNMNKTIYSNINKTSKTILDAIKTALHNPLATPMEYIDGTYVKKTISNYQVVYEPTTYQSALNTITYDNYSIIKCTLANVLYKVYLEDNPKEFIFIKSKEGTFGITYQLKDNEIIVFEEVLTGVETKITPYDLTAPKMATDLLFIGKILIFISEPNSSVKVVNEMGDIIVETNIIQTSLKIIDLSDKPLKGGDSYDIWVKDTAGNSSPPYPIIYKG